MAETDCIVTETVLATLRHHPRRAISGADLGLTAGATDRQVRSAISTLRRAGWLVVGDWSGYRFAREAAEVEEVALRLEQQAMALQETARILRAASIASVWHDAFGYVPK